MPIIEPHVNQIDKYLLGFVDYSECEPLKNNKAQDKDLLDEDDVVIKSAN